VPVGHGGFVVAAGIVVGLLVGFVAVVGPSGAMGFPATGIFRIAFADVGELVFVEPLDDGFVARGPPPSASTDPWDRLPVRVLPPLLQQKPARKARA